MKQLVRRLSFSDRVADGGSGRGAVKKELLRWFSFSDRVGDGGAVRKELMRRFSSSDRVSGRGGVRKELMRRFSSSDRVSDSVPRGCVPVLVCGGDADGESERFVVRVEALRHPSFAALLEDAAQEFGYKQEGVLRVPCAVHQFRDVLTAVSGSSPQR